MFYLPFNSKEECFGRNHEEALLNNQVIQYFGAPSFYWWPVVVSNGIHYIRVNREIEVKQSERARLVKNI